MLDFSAFTDVAVVIVASWEGMGSLHWKSGEHSCFGVLLDTYISVLFFNKTLKVHHFVFLHGT